MLFYLVSFFNILVTSAVCPAIVFRSFLSTLLYKHKELYLTILQRGNKYCSELQDNRDLMNRSMRGMRSASRDALSSLAFTLGLLLNSLWIMLSDEKYLEIPINIGRYLRIALVDVMNNISSCFSFTLNVIQEPVTDLYATIVDCWATQSSVCWNHFSQRCWIKDSLKNRRTEKLRKT